MKFSMISEKWNIEIGVIEKSKLASRCGTLIFFKGNFSHQPSRNECRAIAEQGAKMHNDKMSTDYVPMHISIRFDKMDHAETSTQHIIDHYMFDDTYVLDGTVLSSRDDFDYITLKVTNRQKAIIQTAADHEGESINGYVNKAILARMGLQEWPEDIELNVEQTK